MSIKMHVPTPPHHNPNIPGDPVQPVIPPEVPPQESPPHSPPKEPPTLPPNETPTRPPGGPETNRPDIDLPPAQPPISQHAQ